MGLRIVVVALVPPALFHNLVAGLRARYPGTYLIALIGTKELQDHASHARADEYLHWPSLGTRALIAELRRRRADLLVVAHGRGYYSTLTYWKAVSLALLSGARAKAFCPDGELTQRLVPRGNLAALAGSLAAVACATGRGIWRTLARRLTTVYISAAGLLLAPILVGIAISDLAAAPARWTRAGRDWPGRRQRYPHPGSPPAGR
jgi:hypothetical protein